MQRLVGSRGAVVVALLVAVIVRPCSALPAQRTVSQLLGRSSPAKKTSRRLTPAEGIPILSLLTATRLGSSPSMLELASKLQAGTATVGDVESELAAMNDTLAQDLETREQRFPPLDTQLAGHVSDVRRTRDSYKKQVDSANSSLASNEAQRDELQGNVKEVEEELKEWEGKLNEPGANKEKVERTIRGLKQEKKEKLALLGTLNSMVTALRHQRDNAESLLHSSAEVLSEAAAALAKFRQDHQGARDSRKQELAVLTEAAEKLEAILQAEQQEAEGGEETDSGDSGGPAFAR